jgi:transposase
MASLQRYTVGGRFYYRIVESKRINGKPHPIPIMHIGSADELVNRLLSSPAVSPVKLRSYQHGDVAAFKAMADRLEVVSIIDRQVDKPHRDISVGVAVLLAAINRAVEPCSKRAWADWAKQTSISRLFDINPDKLTSQYFWDRMNELSITALEKIEAELTEKVVRDFGIELDTLFYDTTNFFTYISSENEGAMLAKRGRSKQKRFDLRQFGLALLVSRDGQIPLCSHVYAGNMVDSKVFPDSLTKIRKQMEGIAGGLTGITLVYDKGNNSKENQKKVDNDIYYVASLVPSQHQKLLSIPLSEYKALNGEYIEGLMVYRCQQTIWEAERTIIMFISEKLRTGQIRGLSQHLTKCIEKLKKWKEALDQPGSGSQSVSNAVKQIEELLAPQHLKDIVKVKYDQKKKGKERLSWEIDQQRIDYLHTEVFGKRILMTNRHDWSDEEIVKAYNGQSKVEDTFKHIKDPYHLAVRPQFHWTDHKIRVHTSICLIALMLARLIERIARQNGYHGGLAGLLDLLGTIRLAMIAQAPGKQGGRPRCHWQLEEADPAADKFFKLLVPNQPPFVYTQPNA